MKKLYKSENDALLCGICGGVAEYFNVDSTFVRIGAVILALFGVLPFVIAYLIACFIIPKKSGVSLAKELKEEIQKEVMNEVD